MALPPTRTKGSADSTPVVTFEIDAPNIPITHSGTVATIGTIPIAGGGTGQTTKAPAFDALSPMTTAGDIIIGGASGTGTRLAAGATSGHVLTSNGSGAAPSYQAVGAGSSAWARYQYDTSAGHASTASACIYFTNAGPSTDANSLLTITNSSTNGFKILCNATVDITIAYTWTADSTYFGGITKNSTQLTTNIYSCTQSTVMGMSINAGNTSSMSFTAQDRAVNTDFYHLRIENTSGIGGAASRAYVWIFARASS